MPIYLEFAPEYVFKSHDEIEQINKEEEEEKINSTDKT